MTVVLQRIFHSLMVVCGIWACGSPVNAVDLLLSERPIAEVIDHYIDLRRAAEGVKPAPQALDATLVFANKLVEKRGFVDDEDIAAVRAAGHDDGAIAEIVANVAANIFANYFDHVAQTEIDFPKVDLTTARAA